MIQTIAPRNRLPQQLQKAAHHIRQQAAQVRVTSRRPIQRQRHKLVQQKRIRLTAIMPCLH